jgi:hypothetical protein
MMYLIERDDAKISYTPLYCLEAATLTDPAVGAWVERLGFDPEDAPIPTVSVADTEPEPPAPWLEVSEDGAGLRNQTRKAAAPVEMSPLARWPAYPSVPGTGLPVSCLTTAHGLDLGHLSDSFTE